MRAITSKRLGFAGKLLLTFALIIIAFAVVSPDCVVMATPSRPGYFDWSGLTGPCIAACGVVYCVWFWN
jgi:hypothetical protein